MTPYDVAMLAVLVAGMAWGFWRGIIWQLASIGSLVIGYSTAHVLSGQLAPHFPGPPVVARALAMLATYAAVSGGIFLAAWLLRETLRKLKFEEYDRHLGLVLGGLEGALLGIVATLFVTSLAPQTRGPIYASPTGKVVGQIMDAVGPVLPTEIRTALTPHWGGTNGDEPAAVAASKDPDADTDSPTPPSSPATTQADAAPSGETVGDLVQKTEKRIGKAIADEAKQELQQMVGNGNGGDVERR